MKRILVSSVLLAALPLMADEVECGSVGVINYTTSAQNAAIAVAFTDLSSTTVADMKLSDFIKTTGFTTGDQVYIYNGSAYKGWQYDGTTKSWSTVSNATVDGDGTPTVVAGTEAASQTLTFGSGVWIKRASKPSSEYTITVYGKPATGSFTVTAGSTWLCGNPTLTAKAPTITGAAKGDIIKIPSGDSLQIVQYTYNGTGWVGYNSETHLPDVVSAPTVPAKLGFWYKSAGSSNVTIDF